MSGVASDKNESSFTNKISSWRECRAIAGVSDQCANADKHIALWSLPAATAIMRRLRNRSDWLNDLCRRVARQAYVT